MYSRRQSAERRVLAVVGIKSDRHVLASDHCVIKSFATQRGLVVFGIDKTPLGVLLQDIVVARRPEVDNIWMTDKAYDDNEGLVSIVYLTRGVISTNMIEKKRAYKAGMPAFFNKNGYFTDRGKYFCGRFLSNRSADDYVKVEFDVAPALIEFYRELDMKER